MRKITCSSGSASTALSRRRHTGRTLVVASSTEADRDVRRAFDEVGCREHQRSGWLSSAAGHTECSQPYWPKASAEEQPLAQPLNALPKYIASTRLKAPLHWMNSTLLESPIAESVAKLRREDGGNLLVIGSSELAATLLAHDL